MYELDTSSLHGIRTDLPLGSELEAVATSIIGRIGQVEEMAVGSTGFTGNENLLGLEGLKDLGVRKVLIAHDSITSYLGALGEQQGAVVAAGTGVVTLAVGADAVARVDGWGHIMGDAGSGYWFGRAALDAAMRAYDGRGRDTVLLDRLRDEFGDVEKAYIALQADRARVRRVASFSRWVTEAESDGDPVAADICQRGAVELALSAATALDEVDIGLDAESLVCTLGGVFRAPAIRKNFETEISRRRPRSRLVLDSGDGLDGASRLLDLASGSPLISHVKIISLS
ncbi:BadF/BadG/BcrA/BcrD ATPase family protein [Rathayibacter sp. VKM Ac-2760]|uniref:N-acetylglucosamine kinase n=1 Tax=Rathayibacter sp. VKM Ac-2760 TaxID=2609253 RepID=UPI0013184473|nr:BadF/BadG/BcrA/BcrD ATPase family protein [Rathayibacter sp. VKM Ac-2760]QHC57820.1 ATPase [Rathayibacter sp. VKM Ac-2760]